LSRVGKAPIEIPEGVEVRIEGRVVAVKGPKGGLDFTIKAPIAAEIEDGKIVVKRPGDTSVERSLHGVTRSILANMVQGVTVGFEKVLVIEGLGYRATQRDKEIVLNLGFSHPVNFSPPEGVELEVVRDTQIFVRGIDKQEVGEVAAQIRRLRPPEPYKGKGIRYRGERLRIKQGKAAV